MSFYLFIQAAVLCVTYIIRPWFRTILHITCEYFWSRVGSRATDHHPRQQVHATSPQLCLTQPMTDDNSNTGRQEEGLVPWRWVDTTLYPTWKTLDWRATKDSWIYRGYTKTLKSCAGAAPFISVFLRPSRAIKYGRDAWIVTPSRLVSSAPKWNFLSTTSLIPTQTSLSSQPTASIVPPTLNSKVAGQPM
ncbi:hypothetical protein GQ44DRAFT_306579 [Phaeosphaeriaceae sp. PMI808]|nr:hypothetical protein GQ44DRAFT_306579 [Phaeosphaeriaceae sp. PMI808]